MELSEIESRLNIRFPKKHRKAFLDLTDPIHKACDFLLPSGKHDLLRKNEWLRSLKSDSWPEFLVAFASNGCGDYFAYDLRQNPPTIIYIDPDDTVSENLSDASKLCFESFDEWYDLTILSGMRS
jgi:SMI1 / KNR4 family (SUKH-1)